MALTPQDIHHKEFKSARFGGYNEEEVDAFLDLVADELERLIHDNGDLNQQLEMLRKRVAEFEEMQTSLQTALLAASKSAEAMKEQARQEAESILTRARQESESLTRNAQEQARQILLRAQDEKQRIEREIERLLEVRRAYVEALRMLADSHLKQVEEILSGTGEQETKPEQKRKPAMPIVEKPGVPQEAESTEKKAESAQEVGPESHPQASAPPEFTSVEAIKDAAGAKSVEIAAEPEPFSPGGEGSIKPEGKPAIEHIEEPKDTIEPKTPASVEAEGAAQSGSEYAQQKEMGSKVPSSKLIDEILGIEEGENPYVEFQGFEDGEKSQGKKGRIFRKERGNKDLFWE